MIDWLIIDWLIDCWIDWLIDWSIDPLIHLDTLINFADYYWLDPNEGAPGDAFRAYCNYDEGGYKTCIDPITTEVKKKTQYLSFIGLNALDNMISFLVLINYDFQLNFFLLLLL